MSVPGINLLGMALTVIAAQQIVLYKAVTRTQNGRGDWVTQYAAGIPVEGSWQPVDRTKYESLGLDLAKQYYNFYTHEQVQSIVRDGSPDRAEWNGRLYETVGNTPWRPIDGWMAAMFIDIGAAL